MERCGGVKDVEEASGEDSPMAPCPTTKSLKAAAAAAAGKPQGLFAGFSTLGWAAPEKAAAASSDVDKALAMAMVASAFAQQAMVAANKAAALAALASKEAAAAAAASKEEEEEELAAAKQAVGKEFQKEATAAADDDDATDSEDDDEEGGMSSLEYIKTYKLLPPREVQCLLKYPPPRVPFTDSYAFKALSADPDATLEDVRLAFEEHEDEQDMRMRFCERVRSDYEANGFVTLNDEYIAARVRTEELSAKMWEEAFADLDDEVAGFGQ